MTTKSPAEQVGEGSRSLIDKLNATWKSSGIGIGSPLVRLDEVIAVIRQHEADMGASAVSDTADLSAGNAHRETASAEAPATIPHEAKDGAEFPSVFWNRNEIPADNPEWLWVKQYIGEMVGEDEAYWRENQPTKPTNDKALESAAYILANFKPEGERDKLDEWQGCYALLFKQMNDLVAAQKQRGKISVIGETNLQTQHAFRSLDGYLQALEPGTIVTDAYIHRLIHHYLPKLKDSLTTPSMPVSSGFKCPICGAVCKDLGKDHYLCPTSCDIKKIMQQPDEFSKETLRLNVARAIEYTIKYYKAEVGDRMANVYDIADAVILECKPKRESGDFERLAKAIRPCLKTLRNVGYNSDELDELCDALTQIEGGKS